MLVSLFLDIINNLRIDVSIKKRPLARASELSIVIILLIDNILLFLRETTEGQQVFTKKILFAPFISKKTLNCD